MKENFQRAKIQRFYIKNQKIIDENDIRNYKKLHKQDKYGIIYSDLICQRKFLIYRLG